MNKQIIRLYETLVRFVILYVSGAHGHGRIEPDESELIRNSRENCKNNIRPEKEQTRFQRNITK